MAAAPPQRPRLDRDHGQDDHEQRRLECAAEQRQAAGQQVEGDDEAVGKPRPARNPRPRPAPERLSLISLLYVTSLRRSSPAAMTTRPMPYAASTITACSALIAEAFRAGVKLCKRALAFWLTNKLPIHL